MMKKFTIMWAKDKNKFGIEKQEKEGQWSTSPQESRRLFLVVIRYAFLMAILILLVSHEAAIPKFGKASVEFFRDEFKLGISYRLDDDYSSNLSLDEINLTNHFYSHRDYFPAWTTNFELKPSYHTLIELLAESYKYGLLPSNYHYKELIKYADLLGKDIPENEKLETRIILEQTATRAAIRFIKHLTAGVRTNDTTERYNNFIASIPEYLSSKVDAGELRSGILSLQPDNPHYKRLQKALARYLYKAIDDTITYTAEQLLAERNLVAVRLVKQGYLDASFIEDSIAVSSGLRNLQTAHHINVTGKMDKQTLKVLQQGTKDRFYRIALNLDRIRKDEIRSENSILVNIPEFRLHYYDNHGQVTDFNVVVGKTSSPTPLICSKIDRIVTNPYWTVPKSITQNELLPRIKKDSLYLQKHGFCVVDNGNNVVDANTIDWQNVNFRETKYWIRQTKMNNALGVVKFLFPNKYSVYLHDTQSKRLFNKKVRAYSHGCVRVQNPQDLAQLLVSAYAESEEDVKKLIQAKERKEIRMGEPVSLFIRYYSCTADSTGTIYYHKDIYSKDELAIQELFANSSWN